jgi:molecular chaperone DnaK
VTARDKATGKEQKITVTASTNLNKDEIARKVEEAKRYEADDKKRREVIDARNTADNLVYQTEKALRDLGEKVNSEERGKIEGKITDLKTAAQTDDIGRIKKATDELQNMFYALSQQMYAQQPGQTPPEGGPQAGGPQTPPPANDGDVIDGEVRDA